MRNLKRALSLALASVMLVGLMVVGTGASYSDVTSKNNQEAIEVLKTVGIMTGDDKGNFNPDQNVTRNEMAVIMSNLMDYVASSYKGTSPFADVPTWAEPYVAACYTNGIIAGVSKTTYGGANTVTAGQAALMLLKALGYFQYQSDFGDDWLVETVKQATKIDLFDGVDTGATAALTRNQVAQMVLNALEANCVESDGQGGVTVTGDGFSVTTGKATYSARTSTASKYSKISNDTIDGKYTVQLGEDLYSGDLKKTDDVHDAYGRPATRWEYKLDKIGDFSDEASAVYSAKVTKGTLYSLLTKSRLDDVASGDTTLTVYVDGAATVYTGAADNAGAGTVKFDATARALYFVNNSSEAMAKGQTNEAGKGVQTEVYMDDDGNITLVTIHYYVMKATADYSESKDQLDVSNKNGPATSTTRLDGEDFDLSGYKKNDYILYTYVGGGVEDILPATVVGGSVTAYSVGNNVSLDGTKYDYALVAKSADKNTEYRVGDTASVVVDQFGYVAYVDDAAVSVGNYVYVDGVAQKSGLGSSYIAKLYFTDGTKAEVTLDDVYLYQTTAGVVAASLTKVDLAALKDVADGTTLVNIGTTTNDYLNNWYTYSKNSDGEYTLRAVKTGASVESSGAIAGEKVTFATGLKGNSNTVMIVDDGDDVTLYTGINNFPDIATTTTVVGLKEKADITKTYTGVVIVKTTDSVESKDSDSLMYVLKEDTNYIDSDDNQRIDVMWVIMNGERKTVECKHGDLSAYTLYTKVSVDSDGYYKGTKTFDDKADDSATDEYIYSALAAKSISYSNDALTVDGKDWIIGDDTQVILVMRPDAAAANNDANKAGLLKSDIMADPAADYEYSIGIDGDALDSLFDGYQITGNISVITNDDSTTELADTIILTVNGVNVTP